MRVHFLRDSLDEIKRKYPDGILQFNMLNVVLEPFDCYPTAKRIKPTQLHCIHEALTKIKLKRYNDAFDEVINFMSYSNSRADVSNAEYVVLKMLIQTVVQV